MFNQSAVLVRLNISTWTGRKLDKRVSDEIDLSKNTKTRAGNYNKHLLAGSKELDQIQKVATAVRTWNYEQTLPWSNGGDRLLPFKNFFEYKQTLAMFEKQFESAVEAFLVNYDTLVSASAFQLGDLFDRSEYPPASELRHKFKFSYDFDPLPKSGDFRIDANEEVKQELEEQYEKAFNDRLNGAMKDVWDRLHNALTHMSEKLSDKQRTLKNGETTNTQIFRDSLINNAVELCGLLTKLNVTDDPKLEQARQKLEGAIVNVNADTVRDSDEVRHNVKARVDEILSNFDF
jgi:hypothetical protein